MSLVLWLAVARAVAPEDALDPLLRRFYDEGAAFERDGNPSAAAVRYRYVMQAEPTWHRAALDLGRVLEADGRWQQAIAVYERYPDDADAAEALGRVLLGHDRAPEAADVFHRLRDLRPEDPGTLVLEAWALASTDPQSAAGLVYQYLEFEGLDALAPEVAPVTGEVARALWRDDENHVAAHDLLQDVLAKVDSPELRPLLAEIEVDLEARALAAAGDVPLSPEDVARLRVARETFAAGRVDEAKATLEALSAANPLSAVTWASLADVRETKGDIAGAEQAIRAAERLDPLTAAYPAKLGDLLFTWYAGRYDDVAADAFGRAVLRRPDDADLWFRKGAAERRSGDWARAVVSFNRMLQLDPTGPNAEKARRTLEGTARQRPPPLDLPAAEARPASVPEAAWWAYHRARAWKQRSEDYAADKALSELAVARELAPGFVRAIDLEAAILEDRGEIDGAIAAYEESLRLEPDRAGVVGTLAALYKRAGRVAEAEALRDRAAELGDPDALLRQAQSQAAAWKWAAARRTLATFFAQTTSGASYEAAVRLDAELVAWRNQRIALTAGALGLLLLPVAARWRRRGGASLDTLLDRAPQTWREVARICSAIRHEVLRHHTAVLPGVADALEAGDPEPARWVAARLFGDGALARLDGYVRELEGLGRSNGVRLALRYRDPVFRPLLGHVARLRRLRSALRAGRGWGLADELRIVAHGLNHEAYHALGRLVAGLCVLPVDAELLAGIYAAVRDEPAFRGQPTPELEVEAAPEPLFVRMFRSDLTDVLANLLRNAIQASVAAEVGQPDRPPSSGGAIGIGLDVEEDAVTALDRVVIRVRDRAPGKLTTAALRGRYVARGLGLAVDLTSRAGGSIHVEDEPGWAKAVVVRLPRAEVPQEEER